MSMLLSLPNLQTTSLSPALRIGIVGMGPTALYSLQALLASSEPCDIILFEAGDTAGPGIPFSERHNGADALANIAGFELPPLCESLNQWAQRQPPHKLEEWGIAAEASNERAFFSRVVLGAYFADQFDAMIAAPGHHRILARQQTVVTDIIARADCVVIH